MKSILFSKLPWHLCIDLRRAKQTKPAPKQEKEINENTKNTSYLPSVIHVLNFALQICISKKKNKIKFVRKPWRDILVTTYNLFVIA